MKWGDFREHFRGFAWKTLTPHEVDAGVSNGHEFQGVGRLRELLGSEAATLPATYLLLGDGDDDIESLRSWAKWYDARANNPSRSSEWRLYYPKEAGAIQVRMKPGDLMVLAVTHSGELLVMLAPQGSGREQQLRVLWSIPGDESLPLFVRRLDEPVQIDFVGATILEQLGIPLGSALAAKAGAAVAGLIDELTEEFPESLPPGKTIAHLVRERLPAVDPRGAPDDALFRWMEAEAAVFRGWEDEKIRKRIEKGFVTEGQPDVAQFRKFAMGLRQSRVSRAGGALQYHIRALLDAWQIGHAVEPVVDGGEIPDFIFPSAESYQNPEFPADRLRMLAAKHTAKDRWRQVLNEARRIEEKHLLTLESSISASQLGLMRRAKLRLVMPDPIRQKYDNAVRSELMTVELFLRTTAELQHSSAP